MLVVVILEVTLEEEENKNGFKKNLQTQSKSFVLTEIQFKKALHHYYKNVTSKHFATSQDARIEAAKLSKELFGLNKFDLRGTENLPSKQAVVFIYNHISNNAAYTLDNNFQITLDSHFISSLVSYTYYDTPGTRIIRHGLPSEKAHRNYYDKFDYINVYSKDFLPEDVSEEAIVNWKEKFYYESKKVLAKGENLIISPEGKSATTENSPSEFKAGVFKMIIRSELDPLIVPLVMANFDKHNSETVYRCEIKKPFRLSEVITDLNNKEQLSQFLISISNQYKGWVNDLRKITPGYDQEIKKLIERKKNHLQKEDLIVFYGSSTFRLWDNLKSDFDPYNVLNFGFGGSFIEDCIDHFELLFSDINPKAIVLYVGGNDISLGYSAQKINALFKKLLTFIRIKFPEAHIFCVSIKPSRHRLEQIEKIEALNELMKKELEKLKRAFHINIFDSFFDQENAIIDDYFLVDNLHLSRSGYEIWRKEIQKFLSRELRFASK